MRATLEYNARTLMFDVEQLPYQRDAGAALATDALLGPTFFTSSYRYTILFVVSSSDLYRKLKIEIFYKQTLLGLPSKDGELETLQCI